MSLVQDTVSVLCVVLIKQYYIFKKQTGALSLRQSLSNLFMDVSCMLLQKETASAISANPSLEVGIHLSIGEFRCCVGLLSREPRTLAYFVDILKPGFISKP